MISDRIKETKYYRYAQDVLSGKIVAGELIQLACKRFLSDLERPDLEFRPEIAERFEKFAYMFHHFKSEHANLPFVLEPWQMFCVANMLCFYWKESGRRRFRTSLLFISRKNGKTALAALICLWFLIGDGEASPEVDLSANSRKQAQVAFDFVEQFARQVDPKQKTLKRYRNYIKCDANIGQLNVFAADPSKLDGFNPSFFLVDEMATATSSGMYNVLRTGQTQRANPMGMIISTAGTDVTSPFYSMVQVGSEVLRGIKQDDSAFYMLFSLDEGDSWEDPDNWKKVCPNLGVSVYPDALKELVTQIKNNPGTSADVLSKNFNVWSQTQDVWIPDTYVQKCTAPVNLDDFDEDCYCVAGVDLAAVNDITAVSLMLQKEDDPKHYFKNFYYLPSSALTESVNAPMYRKWVETGELKICEGDVTDYQIIINDLVAVNNKIPIQKTYYDKWNSTQWAIESVEAGLDLEEYSQSIGNMNKATREMERLIRTGGVVIDNNEITRWMFRNASLKYDHNGNCKPTKILGSSKKIDGTIAMLNALGGKLDNPYYTPSILSLNFGT